MVHCKLFSAICRSSANSSSMTVTPVFPKAITMFDNVMHAVSSQIMAVDGRGDEEESESTIGGGFSFSKSDVSWIGSPPSRDEFEVSPECCVPVIIKFLFIRREIS